MTSKALELIIIWVIGVVAFFALWAVLTKVTRRISERKQKDNLAQEDADHPSNDFPSSER